MQFLLKISYNPVFVFVFVDTTSSLKLIRAHFAKRDMNTNYVWRRDKALFTDIISFKMQVRHELGSAAHTVSLLEMRAICSSNTSHHELYASSPQTNSLSSQLTSILKLVSTTSAGLCFSRILTTENKWVLIFFFKNCCVASCCFIYYSALS